MPPNSSTAVWAMAWADAGSATSTATARAEPPDERMPAATASALAASMSATTTEAPAVGQGLGVGLTDAAGRAGDDGHPAVEVERGGGGGPVGLRTCQDSSVSSAAAAFAAWARSAMIFSAAALTPVDSGHPM